jgi:hypothetical protein
MPYSKFPDSDNAPIDARSQADGMASKNTCTLEQS